MPTPDDLMGIGMWPDAAGELGNRPQAVNGAGTSQAGATAISQHLVTVTSASSSTGVILPSAAKVGTPYFITGIGTAATIVYAPVGTAYTMNGKVSTTGVTLSAATASGIFIQMSLNAWYSIPLAP